MSEGRPTPHDFFKVVNGEGSSTPVHLSWPGGINLTTLVEAAPGKSQCVSISKNIAVFHCTFDELDNLSKALSELVEGWISDDTPCGDTCLATRELAIRAPHAMVCGDCDRKYEGGTGEFLYRRWESIK